MWLRRLWRAGVPILKKARLHEVPIAVFVAASGPVVAIGVTALVGHNRKVPTQAIAAPVLAVRNDVAVMAMMVPLVSLPDTAIESLAICAIGVRTVVAIDVARNGVASKAAEHDAPHDSKPAAMSDSSADHATGDGAQDRPCDSIVVVAIIGSGTRCRQCCDKYGRENGWQPY